VVGPVRSGWPIVVASSNNIACSQGLIAADGVIRKVVAASSIWLDSDRARMTVNLTATNLTSTKTTDESALLATGAAGRTGGYAAQPRDRGAASSTRSVPACTRRRPCSWT
jgi:hypothetical protein